MMSLKACVLLLVAVAATTEAVSFGDANHRGYDLNASEYECRNFPNWLNDRATGYIVEDPWHCDFFIHYDCNGAFRRVGPTGGNWLNVPMGGISSVKCWT
ncbi:hypothetical protein BGX27_004597, partial [Mortierella sp. AM989]